MSPCTYRWDTRHSSHQCTRHPAIRGDGDPWLHHTCDTCGVVRTERPERRRDHCTATLPHPSGHPYECDQPATSAHTHRAWIYTDHGATGLHPLTWSTERQETRA